MTWTTYSGLLCHTVEKGYYSCHVLTQRTDNARKCVKEELLTDLKPNDL